MGWEDGVQFQFLASQNTMAALIKGKTIHSWGRIPVNASDAQSKAQVNGADDEIDSLFLECQNMRKGSRILGSGRLGQALGLPPGTLGFQVWILT